MAFPSFNAATLSTGLGDVEKRFKDLNEQMQQAELKKLQIFQALPEGFVPEFQQGALGNTVVNIKNVGMQDPRVQLRLQMFQQEQALQAQAAEQAASRSNQRQLQLETDRAKVAAVAEGGSVLDKLNNQLTELGDSPTLREEAIRNALPDIQSAARAAGGAYRLPGIGPFVQKWQPDLQRALGNQTAEPAQTAPTTMPGTTVNAPKGSAAAVPSEGAPEQTPIDRLTASGLGAEYFKMFSKTLPPDVAKEEAARSLLMHNYAAQKIPEGEAARLAERTLHPERAAMREAINQQQLENAQLEEELKRNALATEKRNRPIKDLQDAAAIARYESLQVGEEHSKKPGSSITQQKVAPDPKKPNETVTVQQAVAPDVSGDAPQLKDFVEQMQKTRERAIKAGVSEDMADASVRDAYSGLLHGEGGKPGFDDNVQAALREMGGIDENGELNLQGNTLVLQPSSLGPNNAANRGEVYPGAANQPHKLLPGTAKSLSQEGLRNMAKYLSATTGQQIDTVRLIPDKPTQAKAVDIQVAPKTKRVSQAEGRLGAPVASAENVQAANKAFNSVTSKSTEKADAAVSTVNTEYDKMTDAEKKRTQEAWKAKRKVWKSYGVKDSILRDMNEAVGLTRGEGLMA